LKEAGLTKPTAAHPSGPGGWGGDWYVWHAPDGLRARAATALGCVQAGAEKLGVIEASYASAIQWDEPENTGRLDFEAVEPVDPTPDQLKEYVGRYESDELAATYRLAVRDGRLWLRVNSRRWEALDPTVRDEVVHVQEPADGRIITFLRNERGEVTGLSIDYYRVKGVPLTKR